MSGAEKREAARWAIGILVTVVIFMAGIIVGNETVSAQLREHAAAEGHPVMLERVDGMLLRLIRIEDKLDRLLEILP